ncbi:MAG: DNA-deoxyinosine glycosylase [Planctomycetaceae bacterium]
MSETNDYARSFPPSASRDARVLVLGSMPGRRSLAAQEYYAHPRNAFWPIMEELFGIPRDDPYARRLSLLRQQKVALWDVLQSCERPGSLDTEIVEASIVPNDFPTFLKQHPRIHTIFFNGGKAEQAFRKYVRPLRSSTHLELPTHRLPSTSPAHAARTFEEKVEHWRVVAEAVSEPHRL